MQNFKTLRQTLLGELAMSPERGERRERERKLELGYVMGYASPWNQFGWSDLENLIQMLPGTTFLFFIG
jgi:hypothetical protein